MNTNAILILTVIVMAAAVWLTLRIGSSLGRKESNGEYSANTGRKLGRLLMFYGVAVAAVAVVFFAVMRG